MNSESNVQYNAASEFAAAAAALRAKAQPRHPRLREAEEHLRQNRLPDAEKGLSQFLVRHPEDGIALNLLAATVLRLGRKEEGEGLLARCIAVAPELAAARYEYANVLLQLNKTDAALGQIEELLKTDPRNVLYRDRKSVVLIATGKHAEGLDCYRRLVEDFPRSPELWIKYAAALRNNGLREQ